MSIVCVNHISFDYIDNFKDCWWKNLRENVAAWKANAQVHVYK